MKKHKSVLYSIGISAVILTAVATGSLSSSASEIDTKAVSPALCVIAEDSEMAMAGIIGNSIAFEKQDFSRALNVSKMGDIEITQAPPISAGELRVGSTVISSGQTVKAENLSMLTYTAKNDQATRASFRFRPVECGYDIPCELYFLSEMNYSPTLDNVPESFLNVSTHRGITLYGSLPCHDPDGDITTIEIISYPKEGILRLTDKNTGEYTYTPSGSYSGKDSFVYVARDIYGNYSASKTVSLSVVKPTVSITYADMKGSAAYNAAITMAEAGIMSGTQVGSNTYFYPEGGVSRGEFVVMVMHAIGMEEVTHSQSTIFVDNSDIPEYMRDYIATAYELGYIKGVPTSNGVAFEANRSITRAEAAVILGNVLDVSAPTSIPVFNDSADIPAWAAASVYSLNSVGVMNASGGSIRASAELTRGDAAQILANLINYVD
ncbi:MAG: S-layer homology domain-containing protein [Clostridia bacterium]|nr:S-layer homology domain-containing protein [Clostridia bacterium]